MWTLQIKKKKKTLSEKDFDLLKPLTNFSIGGAHLDKPSK